MLATPKLGTPRWASPAEPLLGVGKAPCRSAPGMRRLVGLVLGWVLLGGASSGYCASALERLRDRAEAEYAEARLAFHREPERTQIALRFGRAAYEWAEHQDKKRAEVAEEGILACQAALVTEPGSGEAEYYLALNRGQLARTKKLGALKLVSKMEESFLKAIARNPTIHYAGPHRSLGLLYDQAPGWPLSVGSRTKARRHLEKAVALVPEYPGNQLALLEAHLKWGEKELAKGLLEAAENAIRAARTSLTGERWAVDWEEWDQRWKVVKEELNGTD